MERSRNAVFLLVCCRMLRPVLSGSQLPRDLPMGGERGEVREGKRYNHNHQSLLPLNPSSPPPHESNFSLSSPDSPHHGETPTAACVWVSGGDEGVVEGDGDGEADWVTPRHAIPTLPGLQGGWGRVEGREVAFTSPVNPLIKIVPPAPLTFLIIIHTL